MIIGLLFTDNFLKGIKPGNKKNLSMAFNGLLGRRW